MKQKLAMKLIRWGFALLPPELRDECLKQFNIACERQTALWS